MITFGLLGMFLTLSLCCERPFDRIFDLVLSIVLKGAPAEDLEEKVGDAADESAVPSDSIPDTNPSEPVSSDSVKLDSSKISATRVCELLRAHGGVRSQSPLDWNGDTPLPECLATFYREVGPVDITIEGFGSSTLIPSLSNLWQSQVNVHRPATDGLWSRIRHRFLKQWNDDWIVVAIEGNDPFIYSAHDGKILYARNGRGAWEPYVVYPDLNTMAACMAILGSVAINAGDDLYEHADDIYMRPIHMTEAIERIADEIGDKSQAANIVGAAGWA